MKWEWMAAGSVGVGFVLTTLLVLQCQKDKVIAAPGRAQSSVIAGETLILVDEVTFERMDRQTRLVAIDARNGKKLATRIEDEVGITCAADAAKQAWCRVGGAARGIDALTLADQTRVDVPPALPTVAQPVACPVLEVGGDRIEMHGDALVRRGSTADHPDGGSAVRHASFVWSLPIAGSCQVLGLVGDLVVIGVSGNPRALGVAAASGAVRWTFGF